MDVRTVTGALPGQDTLIASWRALAAGSAGAEVMTSPGAVAAVFPQWTVLNNAIALDASGATAAAVARELSGLYRGAGIDTWALWIPGRSRDFDSPDALAAVGPLERDTTTLVMLADLRAEPCAELGSNPAVVRTSVAAANVVGEEPVAAADLPEPDPGPGIEGWALVHDGVAIAGAWSCNHGRDCGIYAVGTVPEFRRRGFGRALVEHILADARRRGALTTTLQSTPMGQPLYESLGYMAAGRYEEWVSR
jgi:GNAT superfamily N-acetyltransferase